MAKQIPDALVEAMAVDSSRRVYPWESWTNGKWWHLEQGKSKDFEVEPRNFKTTAMGWASRKGYIADVRLTQDGQGVLLKFTVDDNA